MRVANFFTQEEERTLDLETEKGGRQRHLFPVERLRVPTFLKL